MKNGWSEIKQLQADEHFTQKLVSMRALPGDVSGADVRRLFVERSGIIREPITGAIGFTHRTFQEFLAARAALHEGDIGVLIQNAHSDQWREAIILASGLATKNVREYLLQELIMRGDEEKEYQHELHLLAVNCLETSVELGQNVMAEVEKRLSKLVPPENLTDVVALASAGELAIPYLSKSMHYHDSSARMCIQTLALIGSEAALEALEEYAHDASNAIVDELVAVWNSFDRGIYARSVLAQALRGSCKCESWNLRSLEGFQYLTRLTSLDLAFCEQISDLRPLSALTQLVSLNLSTCKQISKLRPLAYLTQLTSLDLSFCYRISDLNALEGLNRLETLILHGISHQLGIPQNLKKHIRIID